MWRSLFVLLLIGAVCGLLSGAVSHVLGGPFWAVAGYGMAGGIVVVCAIILWLLCSDWH